MTPEEIAEKFGVSSIGKWLKEYNIPMRTMSEALLNADIGGENCHWYIDGRSNERNPYCDKFNEKFKEINRDFFDRTCFNCGKTEAEQIEDQKSRGKQPKKLDVHHVAYDKDVCCNDKERLLVPLCHSCHSSINKDDTDWEYYFTQKLYEKYNGYCFYPRGMTDIEERKVYRRAVIS